MRTRISLIFILNVYLQAWSAPRTMAAGPSNVYRIRASPAMWTLWYGHRNNISNGTGPKDMYIYFIYICSLCECEYYYVHAQIGRDCLTAVCRVKKLPIASTHTLNIHRKREKKRRSMLSVQMKWIFHLLPPRITNTKNWKRERNKKKKNAQKIHSNLKKRRIEDERRSKKNKESGQTARKMQLNANLSANCARLCTERRLCCEFCDCGYAASVWCDWRLRGYVLVASCRAIARSSSGNVDIAHSTT